MIRKVLMIMVLAIAQPALAQTASPAAEGGSFRESVDLTPLAGLAVHVDGRVKSFESFAASMMRFITRGRKVGEQSHAFTYFDLMFNTSAYGQTRIVYVKKKLIRAEIAISLREAAAAQIEELKASGHVTPELELDFQRKLEAQIDQFLEDGLIEPSVLLDPAIQDTISVLSADVLRTAKPAEEIQTALRAMNPAVLRQRLRLIPPPGGDSQDSWFGLDEVDMAPLDEATRNTLRAAWADFMGGWQERDAERVNAAVRTLSEVLPTINNDPEIYPAASRLNWESWYFRAKNMTWVWIPYLLSIFPLLLYVVFRWNGARWAGLLLFMFAFGLHTMAIVLRWYVSGRWPNTNMFEAVTTAAWMGSVFAVFFEVFGRRSALAGLVAIGSAAASAVALMAAYFYPLYLDPHLSNRMPVLHDVWLYIHTNVIIFSYCLIFMAAASAVMYLGFRAFKRMTGDGGVQHYARAGGAASLIMTSPDGKPTIERAKTSLGQVLDGVTMILMELSFVLLWAGIVMGAIWADHSWGRPWGWDPKEVFALNTFIVFAVLIHIRMKVRDKGMWTAIIAIIGCAVMLFNWIAINFVIAGLHSYA